MRQNEQTEQTEQMKRKKRIGPFSLGESFMMGTAASATQIEGGDRNNAWFQWCKAGHIADGSSCVTACDHWNRVAEDTAILRGLQVRTHRLSLEWSRIEPEPGVFSPQAVEHYRQELALLRRSGIEPLVTLHHFADPLWFEAEGGWIKEGNEARFIEYARYAVEQLGDLVGGWVTINEPNVYALFGWAVGCYPPGHRDIGEFLRVSAALLRAHAAVYRLIHDIRRERGFAGETKVGAAVHLRVFDGLTLPGRLTAGAADYLFNGLFMEGTTTGRLLFPLPGASKSRPARCADFLGINYYTRNIVEFALDPSIYFHRLVNDRALGKTDLGWDIYPEGLYRVCMRYARRYGLPVYITENGIADRRDWKRPAFLAAHLSEVARANRDGARIERYYHWSVMDNFEWLDGETGRFGLWRCDFGTGTRTPRPSAGLFAQISRENALTADMIEAFGLSD